MVGYDWDAILDVHRYFSYSQISYKFLKRLSSDDPYGILDCFEAYWQITGSPYKKGNLPPNAFKEDIKYFFLQGLQIDEIFPLRNFKNADIIDCSGINSIDSLVPIRSLKCLRQLYCENNKINNLEPLSELKNLEFLDLSENRLTYIGELNKLVSLKKLYLSFNKISDVSSLSNLPLLEDLDISKNEISDISSLSNLDRLKTLRLTYNNLSIEKIIQLGKIIRGCKISFIFDSNEEGYLMFEKIKEVDVPFFILHDYNPHIGKCHVALLDKSFRSKEAIEKMKEICRYIVNTTNRENYIARDIKGEHFIEESVDEVKAQFDY